MQGRKIFAYLTILFLGLSGGLAGQTIRMERFLDMVKANHPLFPREALLPEIEAQGRDSYLGGKDLRINGSPGYINQQPLATSTFVPTEVTRISLPATLERAFWSTGGRLSLAWTSDFTDQTLEDIVLPGLGSIPLGPAKFYQNNLTFTYSQPLLQNLGGGLDRLGYDLGSLAVSVAEVQALENQETFLLQMGVRFLEWVELSERQTIARERHRLARRQLEQVSSKKSANLVDEVDVLRAQDAARIAEQGVVLVGAQWKAKQAELAVYSRSEELYSVVPEFDLYGRSGRRSLDELVRAMRRQSRPLKMMDLRLKQLKRQQEGLNDLARPQLFLNAQFSVKGGHENLGDAFTMDKPDKGLFLSFNYPLGNRKAVAERNKSRLQVRQLALQQDEIALDLEAGVRNLAIQLQELEKVLALNERQIASAREKTAAELQRYNQGRGDLAFVIQSQDNVQAARLAYAQNAALYHRLNLQLDALMDELLTAEAGP